MQKISDDSEIQLFERSKIKDYLKNTQREILQLQKKLMLYSYGSCCRSQEVEIKYNQQKAREELQEINEQLAKAEHQYKILLRQVPVNYLLSGDIVKGFNANGDLVVIYDTYENTVAIEYEDYDLSAQEKFRISRVYDNNDKEIVFKYNPDNLLSSITDVRGRRTKYTYDSNKRLTSVEFSNGQTMSFAYDSSNNITNVSSSDKIVTVLGYTSSKLLWAKTYSTTEQITRDKPVEIEHSIYSAVEQWAKLIEQWAIAYPTTLKTVITKDLKIKEYYIFNAEGNNTAYYLEEYGKVTKAEKYGYKAYISDRTECAQKSRLNQYPYSDTFSFGTPDYEEVILDAFNAPKTSTKFTFVSTGNSVKAVTTYDYDDERRCEKATTVTTVYTPAKTETHTGIIKYNYNSSGKVVRSESYIVGEELTTGKTVEETV